jgi:ribonuclease J
MDTADRYLDASSAVPLRVIPLGGVGEIGRNMTVLEYGQDIVVIDCGLMFPEADMLGVDLVIPEISYLRERASSVRAFILTHGHEDHVGALPYVLPEINAPIYAARLTRGLVEVKLKEHRLVNQVRMHTVRAGERVRIGPFDIEFFHMCHSIPDNLGLAIRTPEGLVVHTSDFKFDHTPVDGQPTDFQRLASLGAEGVLLLLCDSTNADRPGFTPSEMVVSEAFDRVFAQAPGRIIVTTFASLISRVQQVIDTAERYGRKVALVGRSMMQNAGMAIDLGYLRVPPGVLVPFSETERLPADRVVLITTGAQGEPTSVLARIANRDHHQVSIVPGDTVVLSATPVPGNEETVNRTIDNLFRQGADVLYHDLMDVHVSGHASQEELKLLIAMLRPRYFLPVHGEYRHLVLNARLAQGLGIPPLNIIVAEDGDVLEFQGGRARRAGSVPAGFVFVDGLGVGDVGEVVLRDRRLLSQDGIVVAVVTVDRHSGHLAGIPDIISRGFVYEREAEGLLAAARQQLQIELNGHDDHEADFTFIQSKVHDVLSRYFHHETRRRPMIIPVVVEV